MMQCDAVWCSVVAMCCSVLQCVAVCCSMLQCVAVYCSVMQCIAVVMQLYFFLQELTHVNAHNSVLQASCCNMLQCFAMCCVVLQASCCNILRCIAVCCSASKLTRDSSFHSIPAFWGCNTLHTLVCSEVQIALTKVKPYRRRRRWGSK